MLRTPVFALGVARRAHVPMRKSAPKVALCRYVQKPSSEPLPEVLPNLA